MRKRSTHVNKTVDERSAYQKYITRIDPQPTVNEKKSVDFESSMESGEELSEPTSKRKRKISFAALVGNHLNKHWLQWLFASLIFIGFYFMVDAKIDIAVIDNSLTSQQRQLDTLGSEIKSDDSAHQQRFDKIESSIEDARNVNHNQDLLLNELKTKLEFIEQILQNLQSQIE